MARNWFPESPFCRINLCLTGSLLHTTRVVLTLSLLRGRPAQELFEEEEEEGVPRCAAASRLAWSDGSVVRLTRRHTCCFVFALLGTYTGCGYLWN